MIIVNENSVKSLKETDYKIEKQKFDSDKHYNKKAKLNLFEEFNNNITDFIEEDSADIHEKSKHIPNPLVTNSYNDCKDLRFSRPHQRKIKDNFKLNQIIENKITKNYDKNIETEDMSIISFLARSDKRIQILKALTKSDKIPSIISKEIGDNNHHISKYLKTLKEKELIICLNEEDRRFRFYSITDKGRKYLKIIEKPQLLNNLQNLFLKFINLDILILQNFLSNF